MNDPGPTKRQREAADAEAVVLHQALGFEVSREELEDLATEAPDERVPEIAADALRRLDAGTLATDALLSERVAILREAVETGGEPEAEVEFRPEDEIPGRPPLTEAQLEAMILRQPVTEATGRRIAYALEVLASAARPDIFETLEAQQDDLGARLGEFGIEASWPEGKTFAEAAEAGEITLSGPAVARGSE